MRINGFEQIKGFYSWVFSNQDKQIRSTHISLYMFLVNQNNRNNWVEWFKCPFDLAMGGSGISNKKTYYTTLLDLQDWKLLEYVKGVNNFKAPLIKLEVLYDTSTVPQSEPQLQPQVIPIPLPLLQPQLYKNIKLLTSNLELITLNIEKIIIFLKSDLSEKFNFKKSLINLGVEKEIISDWLAVRKKKKATNSETAFKKIESEIKKSKLKPNEAIKIAVENSWSGFNSSWIENISTNTQNGTYRGNR
jgi:hypothetical protein